MEISHHGGNLTRQMHESSRRDAGQGRLFKNITVSNTVFLGQYDIK